MSVAELQRSLAGLSPEELRTVESLVRRLKLRGTPARRSALGTLMREMDAGRKHSLDDVLAKLQQQPAAE